MFFLPHKLLYHSHCSLDPSLLQFLLELPSPLPFYLLFWFCLLYLFHCPRWQTYSLAFLCFPDCPTCSFCCRLSWPTSLLWAISYTTSRSTSVRKSPVAHSVCFFLHHFLKSTSSFNIASRHIPRKVFFPWTLADDTSGIHIFPENKIHPTAAASSSHCPCSLPCTLHGCFDSLHSHFLLLVPLRWKSLLLLDVSLFFWASLLPVKYGLVGLNSYAIISLAYCRTEECIAGCKVIGANLVHSPSYSKPSISQEAAFHSYHIRVWYWD